MQKPELPNFGQRQLESVVFCLRCFSEFLALEPLQRSDFLEATRRSLEKLQHLLESQTSAGAGMQF